MLIRGAVVRLMQRALGPGRGGTVGETRGGVGQPGGTSSSVHTGALPKFIVGHPVLGAVPADPETDPVWEV